MGFIERFIQNRRRKAFEKYINNHIIFREVVEMRRDEYKADYGIIWMFEEADKLQPNDSQEYGELCLTHKAGRFISSREAIIFDCKFKMVHNTDDNDGYIVWYEPDTRNETNKYAVRSFAAVNLTEFLKQRGYVDGGVEYFYD